MGHYSTTLLHELAEQEDRLVVSVEDHPEWFDAFKHLKSPYHDLLLGSYDELIPKLKTTFWGVVFLDHSPGERRGMDMLNFFDQSDFIVIHDYHEEPMRQIDMRMPGDVNWAVYLGNPPTLICSRKYPVRNLL